MAPLFEFRDIDVLVGSSAVLKGVTATIPDQRLAVIAGASGSGKTSLLRLCNRLDVPTGGQIKYRGDNLLELDPRALRRRVGMVFQQPAIFPGSVRDNLRTADHHAGDEDMTAVLASVDIDSSFLDRVGDSLSGGEAQRVCLARALMCKPAVLLMDEPTASLHPSAAATLEQTTQRLRSEHSLEVVWVTHDLRQISRLSEHLLVLDDGRVLYAGDPGTARAQEALATLAAEEGE
jgi:putative ABC transport system ATP-binding protein